MPVSNVPRALVIDGRNVKIFTSSGRLVITFGYRYASQDKELRFARTDRLPEQIIIRGTSYTISGDALRWCELVKQTKISQAGGRKKKRTIRGIRVLNIDTHTGTQEQGSTGYPRFRELTSCDGERDRPDYRRLQILCEPGMPLHDSLGLAVHRYLIGEKLTEQARTLTEHFAGIGAARLVELAANASDADHKAVKGCESEGSVTYFDEVWKGHTLWSVPDKVAIPDRWRTYAGRASGITRSYNRDATNPVNAALNYAYTILLYQTVMAMRVMWLDPEYAIDHTRDTWHRYAGAMDLMEPARPIVDRMILDYLNSTQFGKNDFFYHQNYAANPDTGYAGVPEQVSLGRNVRHAIAAMGPAMFDAVAPHVEAVAAMLHAHAELPGPMPTKLTRANQKADNARRRTLKAGQS